MSRVKRGTVRRANRKKLLGLAKGYYANKSKLYRAAKESVDTALIRLRRPSAQEARFSPALGGPDQRRRPRAWLDLRAVHQRPEASRRNTRSQKPLGARRFQPRR